MIVGEAPGAQEEQRGEPFVGASGALLDKLLNRTGFLRTSCFITNVVRHRPPKNDISEWLCDNKKPPDPTWGYHEGKWCHPLVMEGIEELKSEIEKVQPRLIIALGNTPLWGLTGNSGISKWRGSRLAPPGVPYTLVPTFHPAAVLRQEELTSIVEMDLRRAKAIYEGTQNPRLYEFIIEPGFEEAEDVLLSLLKRADDCVGGESLRLAGDLETRIGHIACFGIAWSPTAAICIPFLRVGGDSGPFYWTEEQEVRLVYLITKLFLHPNIVWLGQNYLYDCQYFYRFWGVLPRRVFDTMIGHHSIFSNMRKGLDFLSSTYAHDHVYWKEESKNWDPDVGERQYWTYNCKDAVITWEITPEIQKSQKDFALPHHCQFQQDLFFPVLRMMNRGIRLDTAQRGTWDPIHETGTGLKAELMKAQKDRQEKLDLMAGHPLNARSPKQLIDFFYHDLGLPVIRALQSDSITTNSPAMAEIALRQPALKPLCQTIVELRSIGVFLGTFIDAGLDSDGRMRCSFAIAGPTTFRFSSSENAFGSGMNLQNIPVAEKEKIKSADYIKLPNIRKLFIPDPGYTFFDMDLDRADMQIVAWESNDANLKDALRRGIDIHCMNACEAFDIRGIPYDELAESHPNYPDHRAKIGKKNRDRVKNGGHACDYGVGERKLAQTLGITTLEASRFRAKWFAIHPGILAWHKRTEEMVRRVGYSENKFGARLYNLGRFDLPEHLGWLPQSTVAGVINRALVQIDIAEQAGHTSIQLLIQVHDSLAGQFRTDRKDEEIARLRELAQVVVPYEEPLIIPVGIKTSQVSWGDCK